MNIKWIGSPNFRTQNGVEKKFIVMHWMVGTLAGTDKVFQSSTRKVATNYGIEGKKIHQYVKDKDYAFGSGTAYANKYGISIEHEGGQMLKSGSRKKPTQLTHDTSAQLCAKIAREHNMGQLVVGKNMFPHNKFVATQCPGSLDLAYIANKANEINAALAAPKPEPVKPVVVAPVVSSQPALYHTVKIGEFLSGIAKKYNVTVQELVKKNNIKNVNLVFPGQKLLIKEAVSVASKPPAPTPAPVDKNVYYTIKRGDSYWRIAGILLKTRDSSKIVKEVARLQKLNNSKPLRIGDRLLVRKG